MDGGRDGWMERTTTTGQTKDKEYKDGEGFKTFLAPCALVSCRKHSFTHFEQEKSTTDLSTVQVYFKNLMQ